MSLKSSYRSVVCSICAHPYLEKKDVVTSGFPPAEAEINIHYESNQLLFIFCQSPNFDLIKL